MATIGVCVFSAVTSVAALFNLSAERRATVLAVKGAKTKNKLKGNTKMKFLKKVLFLLLIIALSVSALASCGKKSVVGKWHGQEGGLAFGNYVSYDLTLREDNSFTFDIGTQTTSSYYSIKTETLSGTFEFDGEKVVLNCDGDKHKLNYNDEDDSLYYIFVKLERE